MAYDRDLADRVRQELLEEPELTERKMFGGLAFLVRGHMTVVVSGQGGLMIRTDPDKARELVASTAASLAEMRGRQMQNWLRIPASALAEPGDINKWVDLSTEFTAGLPEKA